MISYDSADPLVYSIPDMNTLGNYILGVSSMKAVSMNSA